MSLHGYRNLAFDGAYKCIYSQPAMFTRRLGNDFAGNTLPCAGGHNCPQVLEMATGDFAVIGTDITAASLGFLPEGSGCGPEERVVRVPRQVLVAAKADIPETA